MPEQAQLDVVINSIANTAGFTAARAEMATLGGGVGLPGVSAPATRELATAERDLASEGNAVARAASSMGIAGAEAGGRLAALGGVIGSTGALGLGVGAAIIGLGGLYEMGKSMIENADRQEAAQRSLAQAYATLGESVPNQEISDFIDKNARFISSMYDAEQGFADLARAGFNDTEQQKLMNLALDLSAAKNISLSEATTALIDAEHGRMLGLISLGISASEINAIEGKHATQAQKNTELETLLAEKLKGARDETTSLKQAQDQLSVTWDKLSNDNGPALSSMLAGVLGGLDDVLNAMRNSDWSGFNDTVVSLAESWRSLSDNIGSAVSNLNAWSGLGAGGQTGPHYRTPTPANTSGRAAPRSAATNTLLKVTRQ